MVLSYEQGPDGMFHVFQDDDLIKSVRTEIAAQRACGVTDAEIAKAHRVDSSRPGKGAVEEGQDKGDDNDGDPEDTDRGMMEVQKGKTEDPEHHETQGAVSDDKRDDDEHPYWGKKRKNEKKPKGGHPFWGKPDKKEADEDEDVEKAKYVRREPKPGGGYRYFYDEKGPDKNSPSRQKLREMYDPETGSRVKNPKAKSASRTRFGGLVVMTEDGKVRAVAEGSKNYDSKTGEIKGKALYLPGDPKQAYAYAAHGEHAGEGLSREEKDAIARTLREANQAYKAVNMSFDELDDFLAKAGNYHPDYGQMENASAEYAKMGPAQQGPAGLDTLLGVSPMNANPTAVADYGQMANATASYQAQSGHRGMPSPTEGANPDMPPATAQGMDPNQTHKVAYGQYDNASQAYQRQLAATGPGGVGVPSTTLDANGGAAVGGMPGEGSPGPRTGGEAQGFDEFTANAPPSQTLGEEGTNMLSQGKTGLERHGGPQGSGGEAADVEDVPVGFRSNPGGSGGHGGMPWVKKALEAHPWLSKAARLWAAASTEEERDRLAGEVMKGLLQDQQAARNGAVEDHTFEVIEKAVEEPTIKLPENEDQRLAMLIKAAGTSFSQGEGVLNVMPSTPGTRPYAEPAHTLVMDEDVRKALTPPVDEPVGLDFFND